jgi:hypothetical protein
MKLAQVLSSINQVEKSKFISCLDKLCSSAMHDDKELATSVSKLEGQIKDASGSEITALFSLVSTYFKEALKEQIAMSGAQIGLLLNILYLLSNEQIKNVRDKMSLSKRGNPRQLILESFANANDKLIENYAALAKRDLASLKSAGIDIAEAEIGVKFEEVTKEIFETLNLVVDEDVRKAINTAKDKADIIISLSEDDVIIGEAKTCKNGDFAKYSTTSRQVKAYVNRCENQGKRVAQVLIIAPGFSNDFVESAEMDTEVNISLLEAHGLKLIYDAYKARRHPKFSARLLTKGGLLKAELIAKNI